MQKDKRIEGVVSLWVGVSPSQGALGLCRDRLLDERFVEDFPVRR